MPPIASWKAPVLFNQQRQLNDPSYGLKKVFDRSDISKLIQSKYEERDNLHNFEQQGWEENLGHRKSQPDRM